MTKHEFETLAKRTVTQDEYKAIETLYMASTLAKYEFVKSIKPMLKNIPEEKADNKIIVGVKDMPNGTYMTYEAEVIDINIATGKTEVKRLSENRCWAEVWYDLWHTKVKEVG